MIGSEVIVSELREAIKEIEKKHKVVIVLRELEVYDADYVQRNGIPDAD